MYYAVLAMIKTEEQVGHPGRYAPEFTKEVHLDWRIVGVFEAVSAEAACQAAAKKGGQVGSFFAVEGFPWGVELMDADAIEFGTGEQPLSRLKQLENRSREMERDAGIA